MSQLLTVKEAASYLRVHPNTVYNKIKTGIIPACKIPGIGTRIKLEKLDDLILLCETKASDISQILPKLDISITRYDMLFLVRRTEMNGTVRWTYPHGSVTRKETIRKKEVFSIDFQVDGHRVRKTLKGVRSRAEAVKVLNAEVVDAQRGKYFFAQKKRTFEEMATLYMEKYAKVNKKSWKTSDMVYLRRLKPYFGNYVLSKITTEMIEEYKAKRLEDGLKNSSVNRELSCLRKIFNLALDWSYLSESPMRKVKSLSEKGSMRERILAEDEEVRLLEAAALHLKPIIMVALYTGFRKGAVLSLKWQNVDFEKGEIRTTQSKTGAGRAVPMNSTVMSLLYDLKSQNGYSEYVFTNPETGKPFVDIKNAFLGACERAGIEDLHFHDLRHTFGSRLVRNGANINLVKELMGHASIVTTQRYLHSQVNEKKQAVEALTAKPQNQSPCQFRVNFSDEVMVSHSIKAS